MSSINGIRIRSQWPYYYLRAAYFPWDRIVHLVANEPTHPDAAILIARYERLKATAEAIGPHGSSMFRRLDKFFVGPPFASRETWQAVPVESHH
jgi:hypothetical protein